MMPRTHSRFWLLVVASTLGASACSADRPIAPSAVPTAFASDASDDAVAAGADDRPTTIAIIGDTPYEPRTPSAISVFPVLINSINADPDVRRVVHIGDIKSGSTLCSDRWFRRIADNFTLFEDGLTYAIGDNEWTDCHRSNNGGYVPTERLDMIRSIFFSNPGRTLGGKHLKVNAQPGYPENTEWRASDVTFASLHIVGSNNGLEKWFQEPAQGGETPEQTVLRETEYAGRNAANIAWLEHTFAEATRTHAKGVVLFFQADLWSPADRAAGAQFTGHQLFVERLSQLASSYGLPVLLVSGDSHDLRVDVGVPWFTLYGLTPLPNVTQLIVDRSIEAPTDASPIDWVKLTIDPSAVYPFSWTQISVP